MCVILWDDLQTDTQCYCSSRITLSSPSTAGGRNNSKTTPVSVGLVPNKSMNRFQSRLRNSFAKSDHSLCHSNLTPELPVHGSHPTLNPFQAHGDAQPSVKQQQPKLCKGPVDANDANVKSPIKFYIEDADTDPCEGMLIGNYNEKFRIKELINRGAFGRIYKGVRLKTGEQVAIKAENQGTGHEKILLEGHMYQKMEGCIGVPKVHWYGMHGSEFNFLVMEMTGANLADLLQLQARSTFSLETVVKLLMCLLPTMEYMHDRNIMHRDISPRNIVIGQAGRADHVFLIDLGLAKSCTRKGQIMINSPSRFSAYISPFVGTPRYASVKSHRGSQMGRSDDLESLGYVLVHLLKGSLPWEERNLGIDVHGDSELALKRIEELKMMTPVEELCEGLPDEFATLISYARLLKYHECPDYKSITMLFNNLIHNHGLDITAPFDWEMPPAPAPTAKHKPTSGLRPNKSSHLAHGRCGSDETYSNFDSCANLSAKSLNFYDASV